MSRALTLPNSGVGVRDQLPGGPGPDSYIRNMPERTVD